VLQPGEEIDHEGLRFIVEKLERRRLLRVRLELPKQEEAAHVPEHVSAAS